tara:strand:- start:706 stop:1242 length:537 start_codon:yes stop_codon:yes gene_type:complete
MINLLPEISKQAFKRMYLLRFLAVVLLVVSVLTIIHSILLVPSYVFLQARVLNQEVEKEFIGKTLEASGSDEVEARLKALNEQIALLQTLPEQPLFVSAIEEVLEVSRSGIAITQISYNPKDPAVQIGVRGIADDRDALRSFAKTLEEREEVAGVDFPIGNLSKEKDLPFNISITLES